MVFENLLLVLPESCRQSGQISGPQSGSLRDGRPLNRNAEDVGLELAKKVVDCRAAIYSENLERDPRIAFHRLEHVPGLKRYRLQSCPRQMRAVRAAGNAHDRSTGVRIPIGCSQSDERGNEIDTAGIRHRRGKCFALRRAAYELQLVPQPLDRGACDEDASLEGIVDAPVQTPSDRGKQIFRCDRLPPRVHQHEASGPVCVLSLAGPEAGLSEEQRQRAALDRARTAAREPLAELRDVLLGQAAPAFAGETPLTPLDAALNPPQQDAVRFALTARDVATWRTIMARTFYTAGIRKEDVAACLANLAMFVGGIPVIEAYSAIGAAAVPIGATAGTERTIELMRELGVTVIAITPSFAAYLGELVEKHLGFPASELGLRRMLVGGEPGGQIPAVRRHCHTIAL